MGLRGHPIRSWLVAAVAVAVAGLLAVTLVERRTPSGDASRPAAAAPACRGTLVRPGPDLQRALEAAPRGATICFAAGSYRLAEPLRPADGQRLLATRGAVLTGARRLGRWRHDGRLWSAPRPPPAGA